MRTFLFNFKKEFAPKVESGEKCQTVRATRKDKRVPVPGDLAKGLYGTAHAVSAATGVEPHR